MFSNFSIKLNLHWYSCFFCKYRGKFNAPDKVYFQVTQVIYFFFFVVWFVSFPVFTRRPCISSWICIKSCWKQWVSSWFNIKTVKWVLLLKLIEIEFCHLEACTSKRILRKLFYQTKLNFSNIMNMLFLFIIIPW